MTYLKQERPDKCDEIVELITKYKINNLMLAKEIGIGFGTFCAKMKLTRFSKFTPDQKGKLEETLRGIGKELTEI